MLRFVFLMPGLSYGLEVDDLSKLKKEWQEAVGNEARYAASLKLGGYYAQNNPDSGLYFIQLAIDLAKELDNYSYLGKSYLELASLQKMQGKYNESIENGLNANTHYETAEDIDGQILSNSLIGHNYALRGEFETSLEYYDLSISLADKYGLKKSKLTALIGKGNVVYYQGDLDQATNYFNEAISISEKFNTGDDDTKAGLYANTGNVYLTKENYIKALELYHKGFNLYFQLNNKYGMSLLAYNIGDAYLGVNEYDSAKKYFNINLFLGQELGSMEEIKYAYKGFTNLYEQQEDFQSAFENYQIYVAYSDSLRETQYSAEVDKLTNDYQNDQKQKELDITKEKLRSAELLEARTYLVIWILGISVFGFVVLAGILFYYYKKSIQSNKIVIEQSELINEKNVSLDKMLTQKEVLLKEVHHRVKNNLQIIASLLNLQMSKTESKDAQEAIEESKVRVQAIALMHKGLYQDEHFDAVDLKKYLTDVIDNHKSLSYSPDRKINFKVFVEQINLSIDYAVPLGLIVSELVSNSVRHAFDEIKSEPTITLIVKRDVNFIELVYMDNGKGLPDTFDFENQTTLGFEIIFALADQLMAEIKLTSKKPLEIGMKINLS